MNEASWNVLLGKIREELSGMAEFIDKIKNNIENIETTVKISTEKFPEANSQLTAVTGDLESAANNIMTLLETTIEEHDKSRNLLQELSNWAETLPGRNGQRGLELIGELELKNINIKESTMEIIANMSFQDLTGQKLKKVIESLGTVEEKLLNLAEKFGFSKVPETRKRAANCDGTVVGGDNFVDQDVVDRLLKELGT